MWNCTHFRHPTDGQLRHVDIYFLATNMICSLSTLNWAGKTRNMSDFENEENNRRSERSLCNCVKKPEKKFRTSTGFEPVTSRFTGAMLYQLSYEATDVGSRSRERNESIAPVNREVTGSNPLKS